jgi:hypothetical protein
MFGDIDPNAFVESRIDFGARERGEQYRGQRVGWSSGGIEARPYPNFGVVAAVKSWLWRYHWRCIVCLMITGGTVAGALATGIGIAVPLPDLLLQLVQR